jgi:hypothetical protein
MQEFRGTYIDDAAHDHNFSDGMTTTGSTELEGN